MYQVHADVWFTLAVDLESGKKQEIRLCTLQSACGHGRFCELSRNARGEEVCGSPAASNT
jgi:hypothetical protein